MAWELINTHPFKDIEKIRSETDRLWDTFYWGKPQKGGVREEGEWLPAVDLIETDREFIVKVEMPGLDSKEIDISLSEGTLTIKGEKKQENEKADENYYLMERSYGSFTRSVRLPKKVDRDKISASYKNGVLKVALPKSGEAKKKEIKIKVE
ncbi:MAG: Hsp20/alpha crystallin family protein [Thermodesulfobacteriota bacterium]